MSVFALLLPACAALHVGPEPPEITLVDLRPLASESFEQRFSVTVRIANPNETPISAEGIDLLVEINDRRLARALSSEPFTVPRLGDETITLEATTNLLELFRQAISISSEGGRLDYALRGRILLADSLGWVRFAREGSLVETE